MSNKKEKSVRFYEYMAMAGAALLAIGCFCPLDVPPESSPAQLLLNGLYALNKRYSMEVGLQVLLCFIVILTAARAVLLAFSGNVARLRGTAIQAWVVLLVFFCQYFGSPLPISMRTGWGWSVLFLGATLATFGSFRVSSIEQEGKEPEKGAGNLPQRMKEKRAGK